MALEPERVSVILDGVALDASSLGHLELPAVDPQDPHILIAEIVFPDREIASTEVLFGGGHGGAVEAELTAVPLVVGKNRARAPENARGWLRRADGTEIPVVALEDPPAEVAIVRDPAAVRQLAQTDFRMRAARMRGYERLRLGKRDRLRFVGSRFEPLEEYRNFPVSQTFGAGDGTILSLLAGVRLASTGRAPVRLTDAVAVAGRVVVATQRRRAVLLVTADCARVRGRYSAEVVRSYLAELRVPLHVWQLGRVARTDRARGFCPDAELVTTPRDYAVATSRLRAELESQQIVWVRGRLMPGEITVADSAGRVRFAGSRR